MLNGEDGGNGVQGVLPPPTMLDLTGQSSCLRWGCTVAADGGGCFRC